MVTHQNSLAECNHISCALPCILDKWTMGSQWQIVLRDNEHISRLHTDTAPVKTLGLTAHKHFQDVNISQKEDFSNCSFFLKIISMTFLNQSYSSALDNHGMDLFVIKLLAIFVFSSTCSEGKAPFFHIHPNVIQEHLIDVSNTIMVGIKGIFFNK